MIETILKDIGFDDKEIRVYLTVLEKGRILPTNVAQLTGINRTTVYSVAKDLVKKGAIIEDLGGKQSFLVAAPPEALQQIIKKEERALTQKKLLVDEAITKLNPLMAKGRYSIPKIQFIYEENINDFLHKQTPIWNKSILASDGFWWGFQDPGFVKKYQDWIDWYWQKGVAPGIGLKLLSNESPIEEEMATKNYGSRIIKFWDKSQDFTATTWINGEYIVSIVTDKKPHYLVQIYDSTLAHNLREMFKGIWTDIK